MLQSVPSDLKFQAGVNFTKSETCSPIALLPCLFEPVNGWIGRSSVSSFVKLYEWIPAMYFVAMFQCCSIFILLHLDGYLLFIADRCHICFACHFQTVHLIPVIFISISTGITSPFQWHSWISKLRPGSIIPCQIMHMHRIPHPAYHTMFMCWLFTMLCASFRCCFFGWVPITSRLWGPVRLRLFVLFMDSFFFLAGFQARWPYPRNHFYLCLLVARSFAMPMLRYLPLAYHVSHIVKPSL